MLQWYWLVVSSKFPSVLTSTWRNNVLVLDDNKTARRLLYNYHILWNWQCCCPVPTRANPRAPPDSPWAPGQWVITLSKHCKNLAPDCGNWFKFTIFYGPIIFRDSIFTGYPSESGHLEPLLELNLADDGFLCNWEWRPSCWDQHQSFRAQMWNSPSTLSGNAVLNYYRHTAVFVARM